MAYLSYKKCPLKVIDIKINQKILTKMPKCWLVSNKQNTDSDHMILKRKTQEKGRLYVY